MWHYPRSHATHPCPPFLQGRTQIVGRGAARGGGTRWLRGFLLGTGNVRCRGGQEGKSETTRCPICRWKMILRTTQDDGARNFDGIIHICIALIGHRLKHQACCRCQAVGRCKVRRSARLCTQNGERSLKTQTIHAICQRLQPNSEGATLRCDRIHICLFGNLLDNRPSQLCGVELEMQLRKTNVMDRRSIGGIIATYLVTRKLCSSRFTKLFETLFNQTENSSSCTEIVYGFQNARA